MSFNLKNYEISNYVQHCRNSVLYIHELLSLNPSSTLLLNDFNQSICPQCLVLVCFRNGSW